MKPFILLLSAAFLSTASLSACSESNKMSIQQQTEARFKLNPEPKQTDKQYVYRLCSKKLFLYH